MRMTDLDPWSDLKAFPPDGMSEDEELSWRYQRYIKDYLRVVASWTTTSAGCSTASMPTGWPTTRSSCTRRTKASSSAITAGSTSD